MKNHLDPGEDENYDPFQNRHKFIDDVWGEIKLNDLERDVIDTPEFQRLFRTSQLGFVELVYQTANHTRGAHSIGACHTAKQLIKRLLENTLSKGPDEGGEMAPRISSAESILISLGALLHDISHLPLSHDLERKSHIIEYDGLNRIKLRSWYGHYDKHDDYESNPVLYKLLCDHKTSVLARVLRYYSKPFWALLQRDSSDKACSHIKDFVEMAQAESTLAADWKCHSDLLPQLLFHLFIYEKPAEAIDGSGLMIATSFVNEALLNWHLGPDSLPEHAVRRWHELWYQPFRHDIIGNTLSADLIDYLARDPEHLGTKRRLDLHLLNYYTLVNTRSEKKPSCYRCAIDLRDRKRGTTRTFLINDIFRLLDLRQEIHEKAVMHRVVQSANGMLARGLLLLGSRRPNLQEVIGLGDNRYHPLQSEDLLFRQLLEISGNSPDLHGREQTQLQDANRIFCKLVERRVYRPLMIIPGDRAARKLAPFRDGGTDSKSVDLALRTLAAIVDSPYYSSFLLFVSYCVEKYLEGVFENDAELFSYVQTIISTTAPATFIKEVMELIPSRVIIWTTPYKQLYKDPALVVALEGCVEQIDTIAKNPPPLHIVDESTRLRLQTGIDDADSKYAALWRLYVFISDGLYYSGLLDKLLNTLPPSFNAVANRDTKLQRLENGPALVGAALEAVSRNWHGLSSARKTDKAKILQNHMGQSDFQGLVGRWIGAYNDKSGRHEELSIMDINRYYHEYALSDAHDKLKRPCRDTRYKFDNDATEVWTAAASHSNSKAHALIQFLKQCHISDPGPLSKLEFEQLVELYADATTRERCDTILKNESRDNSSIAKALKELWRSGFPTYEKQPEVSSTLVEEDVAVLIRRTIADLRPNVRRSMTEDLAPIMDLLKRAIRTNGRAVVDDFRLRGQNEASLIWNDVRVGRIVQCLRRKWQISGMGEVNVGADDSDA